MSARYRVVAPVFSLLILFLSGEIAIRLFFTKYVLATSDERNQIFRYDKELGWFPIPNSNTTYKGYKLIHVHSNSIGFRDIDHFDKQKPRMLFIGDSYTWGFDVEMKDRFTELLRPQFPDWEMINLGVSGYGTDQELMLLENYMDEYDPEIVFLIFCSKNDHGDNRVNINYNGYYKPYYICDGIKLVRKGVPVPRSFNYYGNKFPILFHSYFIRVLFKIYCRLTFPPRVVNDDPTQDLLLSMKAFVEARGAQFYIGLTDQKHDADEMEFLKNNEFKCVDLSNDYTYPVYHHWTPEGHKYAAAVLADYLGKAIHQ